MNNGWVPLRNYSEHYNRMVELHSEVKIKDGVPIIVSIRDNDHSPMGDQDVVWIRQAVEELTGIWVDVDLWVYDDGDREASAFLNLCKQQPTHKITFTPDNKKVKPQVTLVSLMDDSAYDREEWESQTRACWEIRYGEWRHQGQVTPGGEYGEVTIEEIAVLDTESETK